MEPVTIKKPSTAVSCQLQVSAQELYNVEILCVMLKTQKLLLKWSKEIQSGRRENLYMSVKFYYFRKYFQLWKTIWGNKLHYQ